MALLMGGCVGEGNAPAVDFLEGFSDPESNTDDCDPYLGECDGHIEPPFDVGPPLPDAGIDGSCDPYVDECIDGSSGGTDGSGVPEPPTEGCDPYIDDCTSDGSADDGPNAEPPIDGCDPYLGECEPPTNEPCDPDIDECAPPIH